MKAFLMCVLVCLGCGGAPDTNTDQPVYGLTKPSGYVTPGTEYNPPSEDSDSQHCGEWHWVSVWENGQPTAQLQPILCVSGINPDTGDPAPKVVDPNPWEHNVPNTKYSNQQR